MSSPAYFLCISPDHLRASLHPTGLEDAGNTAVRLDAHEDVRSLLARAGVVHGLNHEAIAQAEDCVNRVFPLPEPLLLAQGTAPVVGRKGLHPCHVPTPLTFAETDAEGQSQQVETLLAPLVRVGEMVAEAGPPSHPETGKNIFGQEISCPFPSEQTVHPGDNVVVDKETEHLFAAVVGYPAFSVARRGSAEHLTLGVDRLIHVTPDRMQAVLRLKPAPPGHALPDQAAILQLLDDEQIIFGRLPHAIQQGLELCAAERRPQTVVIALGSLPVNGKDAWLRFAMEIGPLPGKIMGNGEIDFRERNMFIGVNKDQLIAVRIPPTPGTPGRDIFGAMIAQTPGKDIAIKVTDDAAFDEASGEIRASRSGVLSMVSEGSVKVCSRQVISHDIDFTTGNIVSRDSLEIRGSVKPKFRVNALGDILIRGHIEKAQIRSDSNVVVQAGMVGDYAAIRARGDVDIQFVERGRIFAGGSIVLRRSGYYCRMHAGANLNAAPASKFVASQLVAAGSLTVGTVGSDNAEPSLLAAAVSPEQMQLFFELQRTLEAEAEAIEALRRRIGPDAESEEIDELIADHEESMKRFAHLNLVAPKDRLPEDQGLSHTLACAIVVRGKIFAGAEIRIGNHRLVLVSTMSNVCFRLSEHIPAGASSRQIVIAPNKK